MGRTAIFWIDGDRYVVRDGEIDRLLSQVAESTDSPGEAWEFTREWCESRDKS